MSPACGTVAWRSGVMVFHALGHHPRGAAAYVRTVSASADARSSLDKERMMRKLCALCLILAPLSPVVVSAHHSYAMFDQSKALTVTGRVHALEWSNPHVWVWVVVTDNAGDAKTFGFETNAPSELTRFFGWSKTSLTVGEIVTVEYAPLRSGRTGGALRTLTRADGSVLRTPRSDPSYETGPRPTAPPRAGETLK
jgi:hypothetical protein